MKKEYDIVVVGAGPAGTSTAKSAAENGASALVLEKRKEIGVPVRCGEGLSLHAIEANGLQLDPSWAKQKIEGVFIFSPSGKKVTASYKKTMGYVLDRTVFDKMLAERAAEAGAELKTGVRVTGLLKQGGQITGVTAKENEKDLYEIKAKIVVSAEGVEGLIAKMAGINTTHKLIDYCTGFQYLMEKIEFENPEMLEIYFGSKIAPGGYIWVFPKSKSSANVGIGVRGNLKLCAKEYLDAFINSKPGLKKGKIISINGGGIPVGMPLEKLVGNGIMLVGDTAHQVNAIHGGGVSEAMQAGRIAGAVAASCVKKGDCSEKALSKYQKEWADGAGKRLSRLYRLRRVLEKLSDEELDFLADELKGDDIINLTKAQKFATLPRILAKRPGLLRFVPTLLGKK